MGSLNMSKSVLCEVPSSLDCMSTEEQYLKRLLGALDQVPNLLAEGVVETMTACVMAERMVSCVSSMA